MKQMVCLAWLVAALTGGACAGDDGTRICAPGATQPCVCAGGAPGGQVCAGDGSRWGACDCGGADADADADADVDADAEDGGPACNLADCLANCIAAGHLGGECRGTDCYCTDTPPPDAGADADADADADAPADFSGTCLAGTVLTLTPWSSDLNAWICAIDPAWDEHSEPACPAAYSEVSSCGTWGGGWGFWRLADGTYELHTSRLLLEYSHGTEFDFGRSLTGLPEATDIMARTTDYRTLRFRFAGTTAVIIGLTWEPPP